MKAIKVFGAVLLFGLFSAGTSVAQNTNSGKVRTKAHPHHYKVSKVENERIAMKDGKVQVEKNGAWSDLTSDRTLENGEVVKKDGTVKLKSGKTFKLEEGESIGLDGKVYDKNRKLKHHEEGKREEGKHKEMTHEKRESKKD